MKPNWKYIFVLLFVASLLSNAFFFLRSFPLQMGGGLYKTSPNKVFVAHMRSYVNINPLARNHGIVNGDLKIRKFPDLMGDVLLTLTVTPPGIHDELGYRIKDSISWSSDSATATFDLPHALVTITPKMTRMDDGEPRE